MPNRPDSGTAQLNVEIPTDLLAEVRGFANARGVKVREVVALALRRHLDHPPPPPVPVEVPPLPPVTAPAPQPRAANKPTVKKKPKG